MCVLRLRAEPIYARARATDEFRRKCRLRRPFTDFITSPESDVALPHCSADREESHRSTAAASRSFTLSSPPPSALAITLV